MRRSLSPWVPVLLACAAGACASSKDSRPPVTYWQPGVGPVLDDAPRVALGREVTGAGAKRAAAAELECAPEDAHVEDYGDHIRASGCGRLVYFLKRSASSWERASPVFDLAPEDLLPADVRLADSAQGPEQIGGALASLTREEMDTLGAWESSAVVHCILRVDGTLRHCIVISEEKALASAISRVLPTWRYRPATVEGRPVPAPVTVKYTYNVPRPQCANLSSQLERLRCQRLVEEIDSGQRR